MTILAQCCSQGPLATDKQAAEVVLRLQRPYEPEPEPQPVELLMPPPQPTPELPVHFAVVTGPEAPQDVGEALNFTLFSERMPNGSGWLVASRENHVGSSPSTSMLFGPGQTDRFRLTSRQEMGELQRMLVWMWSRRPVRNRPVTGSKTWRRPRLDVPTIIRSVDS